MDKQQLIEIAEDTVKISYAREYKLNGMTIRLPLFSTELIMDIEEPKPYDKPKAGAVSFRNESVIDTIFSLDGKKNVAVLNFASAKNPGGGFLKGTVAQEECLARSSNLYASLKRFKKDYYDKNRQENNPLYTDDIIWSRNITFFKDKNFNLVLEPVQCHVITSPAPNAGVARERGIRDDVIAEVMLNRIRRIIHLSANQNVDVLVLGAFGCGVFKNDDRKVAAMFYKVLETEGMKKYFKQIIFSIYDKPDKFERFEKAYREQLKLHLS